LRASLLRPQAGEVPESEMHPDHNGAVTQRGKSSLVSNRGQGAGLFLNADCAMSLPLELRCRFDEILV
jgi:hypothetical protein